MWWKWIIQAVLALSQNPKVKAWAKAKALEAVSNLTIKSDRQAAELLDVVGLKTVAASIEASVPKPKMGRLIRTERDVLKRDQVAMVDGKSYRVTRLLTSNAKETVYEAIEV
jgi:hypothetical protein